MRINQRYNILIGFLCRFGGSSVIMGVRFCFNNRTYPQLNLPWIIFREPFLLPWGQGHAKLSCPSCPGTCSPPASVLREDYSWVPLHPASRSIQMTEKDCFRSYWWLLPVCDMWRKRILSQQPERGFGHFPYLRDDFTNDIKISVVQWYFCDGGCVLIFYCPALEPHVVLSMHNWILNF